MSMKIGGMVMTGTRSRIRLLFETLENFNIHIHPNLGIAKYCC